MPKASARSSIAPPRSRGAARSWRTGPACPRPRTVAIGGLDDRLERRDRRGDAGVPCRRRARRDRRRGRGGRHGLRLVLDRRGGRRHRQFRGYPRGRAANLVAAPDGPDVARRRHRLCRVGEHGRDDDRCRRDRSRGGREGARQRSTGDGRARRLPGRPRGVRGRRRDGHARLRRLLRPRGAGGAVVRGAGPQDRHRARDDRRRRRRPGRPADVRSTTRACRSSAWPLLEAGVCRDVVYDSQTAARAGRASTGHGLPAPNPGVRSR